MRHARAVVLLSLLCLGLSAHASAQGLTLDRPAAPPPPLPRFRIGAELGGGIAYGATRGGVVGLLGQLGAQITPQLGLFYQGSLLGYGVGDGSSVSTFAASTHSAMVDLTLNDIAQVGVGGGVDIGAFVYCNDRTGICTHTDVGAHPSMSLRAAFLVGYVRNRARWGIPIALEVHTMLWDHRAQNSLMLTLGFCRY